MNDQNSGGSTPSDVLSARLSSAALAMLIRQARMRRARRLRSREAALGY